MKKPTIRCSSLPQLLRCSGSRTLISRVAHRDGDEAFEGVMAHYKTALRAIHELGASPPDGGLLVPNVPVGYSLPRSSEWLVGFFFSHVQHNYPQDWAMGVETELSWEFDRFILTGHLDIEGCNADGTEFRGSDYKCCYKHVDPAGENEQALGYLCLQKLSLPRAKKGTFDILLPRADEDSGAQRISTVELNEEQLNACVASLEARVNAALDAPMQIETGLQQCAWCDAANQCPGIHALKENMKLTLTPEMVAGIKTQVDDATLGDIVMTAKILERPFDDAKEAIKERIAAAGSVVAKDGTIITAKTTGGSYKVIDAPALYRTVKTLISDEDRLANALTFPIGRLTDAIAEEMNIPRGGKRPVTAEKVADAQIKPFCEQGFRVMLQYS